jgi:hypothetical protein
MASDIPQEFIVQQLNDFLDESFEKVYGIYLDKNTSLFETLDQITAEEASYQPCEACASIAAHVKHITFYLTVSERYMFTSDDFRSDWAEIWRTTHAVTAPEWDAIRSELKDTYRSFREKMTTITDWNNERAFGGAWAVVVHTAYHLGEIRRATCTRGS